MVEQKWLMATNALVKQGNSFCVRIPKKVVVEMNAEEGDLICMRVTKVKTELNEQILITYLEKARKINALKQFSDQKIMALSVLAYKEGIMGIDLMKKQGNYLDMEKPVGTGVSKECTDEIKAFQKKYRETIRKEFGVMVYNDYLVLMKEFAKISTVKQHLASKPQTS